MTELPEDLMAYEVLAADALRGTIRLVLQKVLDGGGVFPKPHHAYITFSTTYPGVVLSKVTAAKYPVEMTVVLQHSGLHLSDEGFSVVLSFGGVSQRLTVPWKAISRYYDPAVQFLLQFDVPAPEKPPIVPPTVRSDADNVVVFKGRAK
jgi:hypothetical protein